MNITADGTSTALSSRSADGQQVVTGGKGMIAISHAKGKNVSIYTANGHLLSQFNGSAFTQVAVARGLYLVKVAEKAYKVYVR